MIKRLKYRLFNGKSKEEKERIANILFYFFLPLWVTYYTTQLIIELLKILIFIIEEMLSIIIFDFKCKWFFGELCYLIKNIHSNIIEKY